MKKIRPLKPRPAGARKQSDSSAKAPVVHGYVKSFDQTKLFYSIEGRGKPIIFCYGLICSSLHWTYQIDYFQKTHRAIWFDYRGHQNSDIPKDLKSLTIPNIAKDLKTVLDELNIQDAIFVGHSMGVNVVLDFYRENPERVAGMVLANGTAQRPLETLFRMNLFQSGFETLKKIYQTSPKLMAMIWKSNRKNPLVRLAVSLGGFNPYLTPQADIEQYINQVVDTDPGILFHLIENYSSYDATSWLHTVNIPTLVIAGEKDNIIPLEQQELMHQLIPGSQLEVIQHGSHCPQMDLPDLVNLKIEKFLSTLNYATQSNPTTETASQSTEKRQARGPSIIV